MVASAGTEHRHIVTELKDGWLTVWLNRPEARNALSAELIDELVALFAGLRDDRSVRGITLRGNGGVFCAGGDLKGFQSALQAQDREAVAAASRKGGALFNAVHQAPQVTVALVEGAAMAGGLGLCCAADFVAATRDAQFALTETTLGIPPAQIAPMIVQRIGPAAARRIMLTAARFGADEAERLGIADFIAEDAVGLEAFEVDLRARVRRCAPGANAMTKELVLAAGRLDPEAMQDLAAERFAQALLSDEGREGVAAFLQKRPPRWAGNSDEP